MRHVDRLARSRDRGLAAACVELDLIDEYGLFISPVVVGGGLPFLPAPAAPLELELAETRAFESRVVYLCYERVHPQS